ncbi:hypothetical protein PLESTF_001979000 [Pleodorina starrii]|nr:hypothetical protein PLESTF_000995100 [Pleodorina starrii]GLC77711.1 hypothetical protein PLESTF_001979000 [Pleodorina starrii]
MWSLDGFREWLAGTRLDLAPGPTPWHGLSLIDYHPLETTWCFSATITIFLVHWAVYRRCVHSVASKPLRCFLAAALTASYLLAVLYLHPWQPYWIRELSVMLSQLFAWKVADMALLRYGQPLPYGGFWSWILFDVLVLRPPALVLPCRNGAVAVAVAAAPLGPPAQPPVHTALEAPRRASDGPAGGQRHGGRDGAAARRRPEPTAAAAVAAQRTSGTAPSSECTAETARRRRRPLAAGTATDRERVEATAAHRVPATARGKVATGSGGGGVGGGTGAAAAGVVAEDMNGKAREGGGDEVQRRPGARGGLGGCNSNNLRAQPPGDSRQTLQGKKAPCGGSSAHGRSSSSRSRCSSSSSSSCSSNTSSNSSGPSHSSVSEGSCDGRDGCADPVERCGRGDPGGGRYTAAGVVVAVSARTRLAAAVVWAPLLDFLWYYNACEAVNAYLMHRHTDDILAAPLLVQAWLSACFATALYFHLQYFFYSMEMLWVVGFAVAGGVRCERWAPLFNCPERSTSPLDFWNNRWHQAFRWWWTRLVFAPLRSGLSAAIDCLAPPRPADEAAGGVGGGGGGGGGDVGEDDGGGSGGGGGRVQVRGGGSAGSTSAPPHAADGAGTAAAADAAPGATAYVAIQGRLVCRGKDAGGSQLDSAAAAAAAAAAACGTPRGSVRAEGGRRQRHQGGDRSSSRVGDGCGGGGGGQRGSLWRWLGLVWRDGRVPTSGLNGRQQQQPPPQQQRRKRTPRQKRTKHAGGARTTRGGGGSDAGAGCGGRSDCGGVGAGSGRRPGWARWLRRHRRSLLLAVPTVAVFMFSALFHETLLWINFGRPTRKGLDQRLTAPPVRRRGRRGKEAELQQRS